MYIYKNSIRRLLTFVRGYNNLSSSVRPPYISHEAIGTPKYRNSSNNVETKLRWNNPTMKRINDYDLCTGRPCALPREKDGSLPINIMVCGAQRRRPKNRRPYTFHSRPSATQSPLICGLAWFPARYTRHQATSSLANKLHVEIKLSHLSHL